MTRRGGSLGARIGVALGAMVWMALAAASAGAQGTDEAIVAQGEATFSQICSACHTIGGGKKVGPDLKGVTERREASSLKGFIQSTPPMSGLGLKEEQIEGVIAYFKSLERRETAVTATPPQHVPTLVIGAIVVIGLTSIGLIAGRKKVG